MLTIIDIILLVFFPTSFATGWFLNFCCYNINSIILVWDYLFYSIRATFMLLLIIIVIDYYYS